MAKPAKDRKKGESKRDKATAVTFQAFRRTCATWFRQHGGPKDIQSHLRHASPETTLRTYVQQIPESVKFAVEALDRKLTEAGTAQNLQVN